MAAGTKSSLTVVRPDGLVGGRQEERQMLRTVKQVNVAERFPPRRILGGLHLVRRGVIQMETGQGKTLTAAFPLFLYGLCGSGTHLATTNDYLAERDAELLRPVFELLGLTTGAITSATGSPRRRAR